VKRDSVVPELEHLPSLDKAPARIVEESSFRIQSEARMFQIMADEHIALQPTGDQKWRRIRNSVIATFTALMLGLGGAVAATASGLDNYVGNIIANWMRFGRVVVTEDFEFGSADCQHAFAVRRALGASNEDIARAARILEGIDLAALPGEHRITVEYSIERNKYSTVVYSDEVFSDALRAEFETRLGAAGIDPTSVRLISAVQCDTAAIP